MIVIKGNNCERVRCCKVGKDFNGPPAGTEGTIVLKYDGTAYEVEFFDANGDTIDVIATPSNILELATHA